MKSCASHGKYYKRLDNHICLKHKGISLVEASRIPKARENRIKKIEKYHHPPLKINKLNRQAEDNSCGNDAPALCIGSADQPQTAKRRLFSNDPLSTVAKTSPGEKTHIIFMKPQHFPSQKGDISQQFPKHDENVSRSDGEFPISKGKSRIHVDVTSITGCSLQQQELFRFLVHNTTSYAVRSVLCFVNEGSKTIEDYNHNSFLCRDVFGQVSLPFLEQVWQHRITIMSYFRKLGMYPHIGKRVDNCLACREKGGKCKCPALDQSVYLLCKQSCNVDKFTCNKCRHWPARLHICIDFFFCPKCEQDYKEAPKYMNPYTYGV